MKLNWPALKDTKWLVFQLTSFLMAIVGFGLAIVDNTFWVPCIIFSLILTFLAVNRAAAVTK